MKQVGKSEHQSMIVVLTHSCYHIKESQPKGGGFLDPLLLWLANDMVKGQ